MFYHISKYRNGELKKGRSGEFLANFQVLGNDVKDFFEQLDISLIETKTKEKKED